MVYDDRSQIRDKEKEHGLGSWYVELEIPVEHPACSVQEMVVCTFLELKTGMDQG